MLASPSPRIPEPSTITAPMHMQSFQHPNLKFLCLGKYVSGIAGEKDTVICIVKPKVVIASVRGILTEEMSLPTVSTIHHQDTLAPPSLTPSPTSFGSDASGPSSRTGSPGMGKAKEFVDVVRTDMDHRAMAFTIPKKQLFSFLGVSLYYCPPDTPVHEISGSTVPLFESLAGITRSNSKVLSSLVNFIQHAGQGGGREKEVHNMKEQEAMLDADEAAPGSNEHKKMLVEEGTCSVTNRESVIRDYYGGAAVKGGRRARRTSGDDGALPLDALAKSLDAAPLDASVVDMLHEYDEQSRGELSSSPAILSSSARRAPSPSASLPKPRARSMSPVQEQVEVNQRDVKMDELPGALQRLSLHRDPSGSGPESQPVSSVLYSSNGAMRRPLPGADSLYDWRTVLPRSGATSSRHGTTVGGPSSSYRPVFGEGGSIQFVKQTPRQAQLSSKEEHMAVSEVMKELRGMQVEIERLKREAASRPASGGAAERMQQRIAPRDTLTDSDDDAPVAGLQEVSRLQGQRSVDAVEPPTEPLVPQVAQPRAQPPLGNVSTVEENVQGSLLPLLSAASQQAAMKAIEELSEIQRGLLDAGSKHLNPAIKKQLEAMKDPLRTLYRIVCPAQKPPIVQDGCVKGPVYPSATMTGEFVPVWALVDYGEVNYDRTPLTLRQYHRIVARKIDEEGASHILVATRQQFALDEGYTLIAFDSILDIARGAQPRPVRAQRLLVDGTITRSDEFFDCASCLSIRTRLQHVLLQFENEEECGVWARVLQDVVQANTHRLPTGRVTDTTIPVGGTSSLAIAPDDL